MLIATEKMELNSVVLNFTPRPSVGYNFIVFPSVINFNEQHRKVNNLH